MKTDMFQPRIFQNLLMEVDHRISVARPSGLGQGEHVGIVGVFLTFLKEHVRRIGCFVLLDGQRVCVGYHNRTDG